MAKPKVDPRKEMNEAKKVLVEIMQTNLASIAQSMVDQIMARLERLPESRRFDALNNIETPGVNRYKEELLEALAVVAGESLARARKLVPRAASVKLSELEDEEALKLGEFDKLPPAIRDRILTQNQLLIGTQISDLEKSVYFQFQHSVDSTDSLDTIRADLEESAEDYITGSAIEAGAAVSASQVVNEVRSAFFFQDDVLEEIEAFQFVNGDPVSPICQDLAGTVFAKDDPDLFRYTPPLHWNCKSYIVPVLSGNLPEALASAKRQGKEGEITKLKPSKAELEKHIQFSEGKCSCSWPLETSIQLSELMAD